MVLTVSDGDPIESASDLLPPAVESTEYRPEDGTQQPADRSTEYSGEAKYSQDRETTFAGADMAGVETQVNKGKLDDREAP